MTAEIPDALLWGLRRYLAAPNASIIALHRQPFQGGLSGSALEYWRMHLHRAGVQATMTLIYKRGAVVSGAFLRGAPQREALVYSVLSSQVPIDVPTIVAVDVLAGDLWMLPFPPSKHTSHWLADWEAEDVDAALKDLARLHLKFWRTEEVLGQWPWLARPTTRDAGDLAGEGLAGLEIITEVGAYDDSLTPRRVAQLRALAENPTPLLSVLNQGGFTLLHGDAGFQNIALSRDGRQRIWYDWQLASVGPAALDLVTFLHPWAYPDASPPYPLAEMVERYLMFLEQRGLGVNRSDFRAQLDAALLWRWLIQWAPLLGQYRDRLRADVRARLYAAFEQLHWPALARWADRG